MDFDFGYGQGNSGDNTTLDNNTDNRDDVTSLETGKIEHNPTGEPADDINDGQDNQDDTNKDDTNKENKTDKNTKDNNDTNDNQSTSNLEAGTSIEVGDATYTVDDKGNLLDANGNIFKEAKDVQAWLDEFDSVEDTQDAIDIKSIQDAIGVDILDDNNKKVKFDNTPDGIKSYVNAVIESARQEHYETAINTLYQRFPILDDVINYYIANGNSLKGFNDIPDRRNITIDESNEAQQEAIIRTAWSERGQKGDVTGYINYLKSSGTLYVTAKDELASLQEADEEYRKQLDEEANRKEQEEAQIIRNYWNGVHEVIKNRKIAGYQIPESILITRNGQKFAVTPEDFFNYIYRVDKNGKSAYEYDLAKQTPESRRDDEILRAYLTFVGGNYSNLVDMAINKKEVEKLRLKAKERNTTKLRINRPTNTSKKGKDIDLGYN